LKKIANYNTDKAFNVLYSQLG